MLNNYQTITVFASLLYVALPLMTWTILRRRHRRRTVVLWCAGSLLYGASVLLIGLRDMLPAWLFVWIAGPMFFASYPLRAAALRDEARLPTPQRLYVLCWAVSALVHVLATHDSDDPLHIVTTSLMHFLGSIWLCHEAHLLHRATGYHFARVLRNVYGVFALVLAVRFITVALFLGAAAPALDHQIFILMVAFAIFAALYGNMGYIGMALEAARREELALASDRAREQERRLQTELRMEEQSRLLVERGRLLAHREEMLATLAHEVRQPLNNASAALESATQAIADGRSPTDRDNAAARLQRARSVLTQVASAVDNTLADAVLLAGTEPIRCQDTDVDTLVELAIADIDGCERGRVQVQRATATRTASMNIGLMRLALRNLIGNALAYSPPGTPVVVRIDDSDEPLALVIEVRDQGPGIPDELMPRLFSRGARGTQARHRVGHGLGLFIVRRVMDLHRGTVEALHDTPQGACMRLVLPQGMQT